MVAGIGEDEPAARADGNGMDAVEFRRGRRAAVARVASIARSGHAREPAVHADATDRMPERLGDQHLAQQCHGQAARWSTGVSVDSRRPRPRWLPVPATVEMIGRRPAPSRGDAGGDRGAVPQTASARAARRHGLLRGSTCTACERE
jgi:hypothetical protein